MMLRHWPQAVTTLSFVIASTWFTPAGGQEAAGPAEVTREDVAAEKTDAVPEEVQPLPVDVQPVSEPLRPGVWTTPPTDGEPAIDFKLVGEYVGELSGELPGILALQIRNIGDGEFEARTSSGGLPGQAGFDESTTVRLIGRRSGATLVLSGGPWALFASPDSCTVIAADATLLGKLDRVDRRSPTLGALPPDGAIALMTGTGEDAELLEFAKGELSEEGWLMEGADVKPLLHDFDLHVEFRIPHMPAMRDQKRGNSGLYLQGRYECQVLDSFGDDRVFNGLGALYRFKPADVNMALPPLTWQTYDVRFTAARFNADGSRRRPAHVSAWINGVLVHDNVALTGPTGNGQPETPTILPTKLQDHSDPVRYRNAWVIDRGLTAGIEFPVQAE